MLDVIIKKVETKKDLDEFIKFPWKVYKNDENWVPPLIFERKDFFNKKKNPFFLHGDAELYLAIEKGETIGTISAHIDHLYDEKYGKGTGFFGFFECFDRREIAWDLFKTVENYMRNRNVKKILGPFNFTINESCGLLIEGFDTPPSILTTHNPPYYQNLIEKCGFEKIKDLFAWHYIVGEIPQPALQIAEATMNVKDLKIRSVDKKNLSRDVNILVDVFNDAWGNNWGFVPMTEIEVKKMADDLKLIIEPELALIAEYRGEPAAIALALPNINEIIKDLDGCQTIMQKLKLLYRLKFRRIKSARLLLLGIKHNLRGGELRGLSVLLYVQMHKRGQMLGITHGELSWTLEDNEKINKGIELMGGRVYKKYRIYQKEVHY